MEANNMAAMRDALEKARHVLHCAIVAGILKGDDAYDAVNMATAALSAPARNCDVGTPQEQYCRWKEFCNGNWSSANAAAGLDPCDDCQFVDCDVNGNSSGCQFAWSQIPYEEVEKGDEPKEAEASEDEPMPVADKCPWCGEEPKLIHPAFDGGTYVECPIPLCRGYANQVETWAETDRGAIIRWNEFVKTAKGQHEQENSRGNPS